MQTCEEISVSEIQQNVDYFGITSKKHVKAQNMVNQH